MTSTQIIINDDDGIIYILSIRSTFNFARKMCAFTIQIRDMLTEQLSIKRKSNQCEYFLVV